eukprot:TRINITY_DN14850_c3_g1_i1.p1 TRINITY_DN14850_c3_g1~~TRINITY_DN14850_c3_g1_i1.p1  ORF type:complete len:136 (+),score=0.46 TRINITY_DN14850_c3_g1_i1:131-538(+)
MDMQHNGNNMEMMSMQMYFTWGYDVIILFKDWSTQGPYQYYFSCVVVALMGIVSQYLKVILEASIPATRPTSVNKLAHTLIYGLVITISYLLMLVSMTYNVGLFAAVIIGHMIGFYMSLSGRAAAPSPTAGCIHF